MGEKNNGCCCAVTVQGPSSFLVTRQSELQCEELNSWL